MRFFETLLQGNPVAHDLLVLSAVAAIGLALGHIRFRGANFGIAGVLFGGLAAGHFGWQVSPPVLDFTRDFGLVLFVFAIGLQIGPGFFSSLRRDGLPLNLLAAAVVFMGWGCAWALKWVFHWPVPTIAGIFAGASTNTPSLAAAQQAMRDTGLGGEPSLAYAVCYPFAVLGILAAITATKVFFFSGPESRETAKENAASPEPPSVMNMVVRNPEMNDVPVNRIPGMEASSVVVSRIMRHGVVRAAMPDMLIQTGDILLAVGPKEKLEELRRIVGEPTDIDLQEWPSDITTRRIVVTRRQVVGKTLGQLDMQRRFGVTVTRMVRSEIEFLARMDLRPQFGDVLQVVGPEDAIVRVAAELGNAPKSLHIPHMLSIFIGLMVGVLIGTWPIYFSGLPSPVRLGLAGGPLVVAMILSRMGNIGPLVWYVPVPASLMLREIGIVLFLSCVGLSVGGHFLETLVHGPGLIWLMGGLLITLVPLAVAIFFGRKILKLSFPVLGGFAAGSMTDPPALAYANTLTGSDSPAVAYATVYPLTMILRVVCVQLFFLLG